MSVLGKRFAAKATPFLALIGISGVVSFYPAHAQQQTTSTQQNAETLRWATTMVRT